MISSIEIIRFRGIREGKVDDLTPLVVFVGPNGSGKSTVLDAMLIGARTSTPHQSTDARQAIQRHPGVPQGGCWFAWRADIREPTAITITTRSGVSWTWELAFGPQGITKCSLREPGNAGKTSGRQLRSLQEAIGAEDIETRLVDPRVFENDPPLHKLFTQAVNQGRREQARAILAEVVPRVNSVEILTEGDMPIVHVVYPDHSVPAAFAGDGIYSLVRLSLELASRPNGVVLLEEPEVHQHPRAIGQSARAIWAAVRRGVQVILTTHSLEMVDFLLSEVSNEDLEKFTVYRLQLADGNLSSRRIPGPEVAFLRTEIENDLR